MNTAIMAGYTRGLSPPTRGNHEHRDNGGIHPRSIPAHAGEPFEYTVPIGQRAVYPRPRGGTSFTTRTANTPDGLSPPTRGNPGVEGRHFALGGSIPAHAGEPDAMSAVERLEKVYPRPRGGTQPRLHDLRLRHGLSPPTRGNPRVGLGVGGQARSIPAHAGEP